MAASVHGVSVCRRGRISRVQKLVSVPDHLAQESGEHAELNRLPFGGQVDTAVDERSHERQIGFAPFADQLGDQCGQPRFVLLLQIVNLGHAK
jgi:hypothetical protein